MNAEHIALPELDDERLALLEDDLFSRLADEPRGDRGTPTADRERARAVRRGRIWMAAAAAAAVVAVAAIIAPQLHLGAGDASSVSSGGSIGVQEDSSGGDALPGVVGGEAESAGGGVSDESADGAREVVATASASLLVEDVARAAERITASATAAGGYVEALSLDSGDVAPDTVSELSEIEPAPTGAWITVRVPADRLDAAMDGLSDVGEVTSSRIDRQDVTTDAVDLRARIAALEASVDRLTELMGQATSTADLLTAEQALAERQSELDSLRSQLELLEGQVGMSTLTVSLTERTPTASADPAGFGDGLAAGWNGLVTTLNGVVVALGFLLPWIAVAAVAVLVVWGVRALVRARRASKP